MQDLYTWLKFIHVVGVTIWFGSFATMIVYNAVASRNAEPQDVRALLRFAEGVGPRLMGPASGIALLAGFGGMGTAHLGMKLWIVWGIVGTVLFIVIGVATARPVLKQLSAAVANNAGPAELRPLLARQRGVLLLNLVVLLSIVWAMVFKPV